ncbi:hypothetical protein ASPCAL12379 [Aspergillus calidoustus]|uniref:Uncharacterized protein n=1 Tax=Aspergillus calidoustus TaxID=454130 RepID=A0A0U5GEX9_ASPCI|nr:hypothetical protein ASPCAL12379 [Aspergillus calidoustus]
MSYIPYIAHFVLAMVKIWLYGLCAESLAMNLDPPEEELTHSLSALQHSAQIINLLLSDRLSRHVGTSRAKSQSHSNYPSNSLAPPFSNTPTPTPAPRPFLLIIGRPRGAPPIHLLASVSPTWRNPYLWRVCIASFCVDPAPLQGSHSLLQRPVSPMWEWRYRDWYLAQLTGGKMGGCLPLRRDQK